MTVEYSQLIVDALGYLQQGNTAAQNLSGIKSVIRDLFKKEAGISSDVKNQLNDFLDEIINVKLANMEALEAINKLKTEIEKFEKFEQKMKNYRLVESQVGNFVYELILSEDTKEPKHRICTNCVNDRRISILQGHQHWGQCPHCKAEFQLDRRDQNIYTADQNPRGIW